MGTEGFIAYETTVVLLRLVARRSKFELFTVQLFPSSCDRWEEFIRKSFLIPVYDQRQLDEETHRMIDTIITVNDFLKQWCLFKRVSKIRLRLDMLKLNSSADNIIKSVTSHRPRVHPGLSTYYFCKT